MLTINLAEEEFYDSEKQMFFNTKPLKVRMEHSLISIAKWESIWEKPYIPVPGRAEGMQGYEEELSYIRCMIIGEVDDYVPPAILQNHGRAIANYIEKKHTATTIYRRGPQGPPNREVITSELVYYWMTKFGIPFECERWHFNRLLMLIDVCQIKESANTKGGKIRGRQAQEYMMQLNKARRGG
jgi:hypothetical protein